MQELGSLTASRSARARVAARPFFCGDIRQGGPNGRRSRNMARVAVWRRTEMGTNHIACFGVWRRGTRRQVAQAQRPGSTRWHMPHRAVVVMPGACHESLNQD